MSAYQMLTLSILCIAGILTLCCEKVPKINYGLLWIALLAKLVTEYMR